MLPCARAQRRVQDRRKCGDPEQHGANQPRECLDRGRQIVIETLHEHARSSEHRESGLAIEQTIDPQTNYTLKDFDRRSTQAT